MIAVPEMRWGAGTPVPVPNLPQQTFSWRAPRFLEERAHGVSVEEGTAGRQGHCPRPLPFPPLPKAMSKGDCPLRLRLNSGAAFGPSKRC
jgi:hypothetical protein